MNDKNLSATHNFILKNRREAFLDGVFDVMGFDEASVSVKTALGDMMIEGRSLHIKKMSLESGEMSIEGEIDGIYYADEKEEKKGGLLRRFFR